MMQAMHIITYNEHFSPKLIHSGIGSKARVEITYDNFQLMAHSLYFSSLTSKSQICDQALHCFLSFMRKIGARKRSQINELLSFLCPSFAFSILQSVDKCGKN